MKIIIVIAAILIYISSAYADPYLGCDLPPSGITITWCQVEITKGSTVTYQDGICRANSNNSAWLLMDVASLAAGDYVFRARWSEATYNPSDWSTPFTWGKPKGPSGLRIIAK